MLLDLLQFAAVVFVQFPLIVILAVLPVLRPFKDSTWAIFFFMTIYRERERFLIKTGANKHRYIKMKTTGMSL